MTFNPVTWNTTQPSPTQNISSGQGTILNNFSFLQNTSGNALPGFLQLPSGLLLQWGTTGSLTSTSSGTAILFSSMGLQSFPTNCFGVWLQPISSTVPGKFPVCIGPGTLTASGFTYYLQAGSSYSAGNYIFAIGN